MHPSPPVVHCAFLASLGQLGQNVQVQKVLHRRAAARSHGPMPMQLAAEVAEPCKVRLGALPGLLT
jgi:hypothetical protein